MACFWKNERNAVEVCLREVGNYVYIGYEDPDPDYTMIEVARDLSGYVKTAFAPPGSFGDSLYSKRRKIYIPSYNTTPNPDTVTIWRDDGAGVFSEISGVPTGLASYAKEVICTAGKLRAVNEAAGDVNSLYESDDGETWTLVPGSMLFPAIDAGFPSYYTVLDSRLIAVRKGASGPSSPAIRYSDDGGATWAGGAGTAVYGSGNLWHPFTHSGTNIIAVQGGTLFVSADGAAWTEYTGLRIQFFAKGPKMAASGTGHVVAAGTVWASGLWGFAYSANHGASWSLQSQIAGGLPDASEVYALFWDDIGEQFVVFVERGDIPGTFQIYTSPTGQNWTAGLVIPDIVLPPVQVID
jgi:hypothetical protein